MKIYPIYILLILSCISYFLGQSLAEEGRDYLHGAIYLGKINDNSRIDEITFHFKDFPYDITTKFNPNGGFDEKFIYPEMTRHVYDTYNLVTESIEISDRCSWFVGTIVSVDEVERSEYINRLVFECSLFYQYNHLAKEENTTAITFYPKMIDGKVCTVLEFTGESKKTYHELSNVIGIFMPLNETKNGCDEYLMLYSANQTTDWLDSVKVSKREIDE